MLLKTPYEHRECEQIILRDYLAIDRTVLANERTFLAYVRTTLALLAAGASFIQFFQLLWLEVIGYLLIVSAVVLLTIGIKRFLVFRGEINKAKQVNRNE